MRKTRIIFFITTIVLISIGIVMIYSASALYGYERYHDSAYFLKRHMAYLLAGIALMLFVMSVEVSEFQKYTKPIFIVSISLLILLLVPGVSRMAGGAKRWFKIGPFNFQPSEFAKFAAILYLADMLVKRIGRMNKFLHGFVPPIIVIGLFSGLIILQPDLGTAVAIGIVGCLVMFIGGANPRHISLVVVSSLPVLWMLIAKTAYRMRRITAFFDPWNDPRGVGFQIIQSFIALGSGGLFGVGLGQSRQKLFYLPASHTDFIFSIIGEELGLLGTLGVVMLFVIFLWQGAKIIYNSKTHFMQLAGMGLLSMLGLEAMINIAVATGSMPTKGLPLPFISYGGSSLLFNMAAVGFILNIGRDKNQVITNESVKDNR